MGDGLTCFSMIALAIEMGDVSGKVVAVIGIDELAWTKQASDLVAVLDQDIKQRKLGNSVEVRISVTATATAREGLRERGWKVFERISN